MFKLGGLLAVVCAMGWLLWNFIGTSYSRTVEKPPAEVASALYNLDLHRAPGAPGTDASRSGGEQALFAVEGASDHVSYTVTAHGEMAARLTAWLKPVDGGKHTLVTTSYERGPAPDDYMPPAFRSKGVSLGLFAAVLEDKLDQLVFKTHEWNAECDKIQQEFEAGNADQGFNSGRDPNAGGFTHAFANTAKVSMRLAQFDKKLKEAGCPTNSGGGFSEPTAQLTDTSPEASADEAQQKPAEYGQPTMNLDQYH